MLLDATASIFRIDVILRAWQLIAVRIAWWRLSHIAAATMIAPAGARIINRFSFVVHNQTKSGDTRRENFARIDC